VFDYAMQGRILGVLGGNPYVDLPLSYPADPFLPNVGWKQFPDVYGPFWTYLGAVIARLSGPNLVVAVLAFKGIAALASVACSYLAYRIARMWQPARAAAAVVLIGWNPLVIVMAGTGHNDVAMMSFVLAGIWVLARHRAGLGLWVIGVSTLVKLATAPLLPILAIGAWAERRQHTAPTVLALGASMLVLAVTSFVLYAPLWPGWDNFGPFLLRGNFTASPLGLLRNVALATLGESVATEWTVRLGDLLLVLIVATAMWRARHGLQASIRAAHDALFWMAIAILGWTQPWYIVWVACLASLDGRPWVPALSWVAATAGLVSLFDRFYLTQHWLAVDTVTHHIHSLLLVSLAPILCALIAPRWGALRSGTQRAA
jgi:alpha-1,6-mannosyltransferase